MTSVSRFLTQKLRLKVNERRSGRRRFADGPSGACQDTRRSNRPCAITTSTHSFSLDFMFPIKLNLVEPPGT